MARLVAVTGVLALIGVLFTACGGGGAVDGAKVEAGLQHYLGSDRPEGMSRFPRLPTGRLPTPAGVPQVRRTAARRSTPVRPARIPKGQVALRRGSRLVVRRHVREDRTACAPSL